MRRWLGWIAIGWLLGVAAVALLAYGNGTAHASLDEQARAVAAELRCPVCQSESVADSPAAISKSMRAIIRERLSQGQTPDQIKRYFVSKYGDWILLSPPSSGVGDVAWLAPPLLVLGGIGLLVTLIVDWRRRGRQRLTISDALFIERVRAEVSADATGD